MEKKRMKRVPVCLSIAGSDPSGGAGIQADLKTFSALGCYGAAAITALTVQDTTGVHRSVAVEAELVYEQAAAVLGDLQPDAVKIGMVANRDTVEAVARLLGRFRPAFVVLDPIILSSSGRRLLDAAGCEALLRELAPLCSLLTPNLPELEMLTGRADTPSAAKLLMEKTGCNHVLAKGGHNAGEPVDMLVGREDTYYYPGIRIHTPNTHGTGCTLSSAIAAFMARGEELPRAVERAKDYVQRGLAAAADLWLGHGHGAINHFYAPSPLLIEENT